MDYLSKKIFICNILAWKTSVQSEEAEHQGRAPQNSLKFPPHVLHFKPM